VQPAKGKTDKESEMFPADGLIYADRQLTGERAGPMSDRQGDSGAGLTDSVVHVVLMYVFIALPIIPSRIIIPSFSPSRSVCPSVVSCPSFNLFTSFFPPRARRRVLLC
jgi:hypothetical protein